MVAFPKAFLTLSVCLNLVAFGIETSAGQSAEPMFLEINTTLMETTFRIQGPSSKKPNSIAFGTGFLVGKPIDDKQANVYMVLVTAAHVFDEIAGDEVSLTIRERLPDGRYSQKLWPIKIRDQGKPIFVRHKEADVAAIYAAMPATFTIPVIPLSGLVTDEDLQRYEIHAGDDLLCLGFPLYTATEFGFPILRSGKIASHPIVPTSIHKLVLFDFQVFKGNSGGPVYFVGHSRRYGTKTHLGEVLQFVVGLVTSEIGAAHFSNELLQIGGVVPASYIRQTIALLPSKP